MNIARQFGDALRIEELMAEVARLRAVVEFERMMNNALAVAGDRLHDEVRRLNAELADARRIALSLANRVTAQAEILSRRAERVPATET